MGGGGGGGKSDNYRQTPFVQVHLYLIPVCARSFCVEVLAAMTILGFSDAPTFLSLNKTGKLCECCNDHLSLKTALGSPGRTGLNELRVRRAFFAQFKLVF